MANNRMYLVHRPTKIGVMLSSRLAGAWSFNKLKTSDDFDRFYQLIYETHGISDDFIIADEGDVYGDENIAGWVMTQKDVEGFPVFEFLNEKQKE